MNADCLDIGTIQAFLDGELAPEVSTSVSGHIASCDACSMMLGEAEEETAFVFPVLEREMNTLVPTQRLWARINDSIAVEKENTPFWKKAWAGLVVSLRNPSISVAASILIVIGVFTAVYSSLAGRVVDSGPQYTAREQPGAGRIISTPPISYPVAPVGSDPVTTARATTQPVSRTGAVAYEKATYTKPIGTKDPSSRTPVNPPNTDGYLPGEESYVKTIATLSQSVDGQKDSVLRPSQQVAYERDIAVVDDSIKRMRKEVRKNPRNESAKQVLYTSYQNKIDLLNSVAQKGELVASLK